MELYRDLVFKRNIHGYAEETRVQLYRTHIRQLPFWVVYHPHNEELDLRKVEKLGSYFLAPESVVGYFRSFYNAWATGSEFIPSIDMTDEALHALRSARPDPNGLMYRVIYRNPFADIPECAFGHGLYDIDEPRFVSTKTSSIGHWCIYNEHVAKAVTRVHAAMPFSGYVWDRLCNNPSGGYMVVQATPFNPSGNPIEGEEWRDIEEAPVWNISVRLDFNADMSDIETIFELKH
ncbi:hypothetical protein ST201phi2-1p395 [Pseudomonas phage 201phi2-1]|uniref:Uncharacterized protein n=1 Tax=Pseudomonas phage 201phi2-1 TaxID=198110 RepID=B3FJQ4_BP201|nr:hypothetical protein ST201phi2-1p395 [Pseudomonas phage 201phi2-1]ABY63219.1 hypothetical protein 201phi2-1p395 [Pseudomonas phage 201phi2-1]